MVLTEKALQVGSEYILLFQLLDRPQSSKTDDTRKTGAVDRETEELTDGLRRTAKEVRIPVVDHLRDVVTNELNLFPILLCLQGLSSF